jgi:hypothetical protein
MLPPSSRSKCVWDVSFGVYVFISEEPRGRKARAEDMIGLIGTSGTSPTVLPYTRLNT